MTVFLLVLAAFAAGVINSVAGGGSFLTFPALVFSGVPSVVANASSTVALLTGSVATGFSYRNDIRRIGKRYIWWWLLLSVAGGALGAILLLSTSDHSFRQIAPWLLLFATLVFAFGGPISQALRGRAHSNTFVMLALLFPITVYGGYFGGGMGIMLLAAFRLFGLTDIHGMNGMKALIAATLNSIAAAIFIAAHQVAWRPTLYMTAAGIAGGYLGPVLARRIPQHILRIIVIAIGSIMTLYFFWDALH